MAATPDENPLTKRGRLVNAYTEGLARTEADLAEAERIAEIERTRSPEEQYIFERNPNPGFWDNVAALPNAFYTLLSYGLSGIFNTPAYNKAHFDIDTPHEQHQKAVFAENTVTYGPDECLNDAEEQLAKYKQWAADNEGAPVASYAVSGPNPLA